MKRRRGKIVHHFAVISERGRGKILHRFAIILSCTLP